jgi:hypothetical protein
MIEATRRKLDEARFFYGHLFNERRKTFGHKAFRYYFSAFIQDLCDVDLPSNPSGQVWGRSGAGFGEPVGAALAR